MAQKKYGDLVEYVHNVQELVTNEQGARVRVTSLKTSNALVISSSIHDKREQLQLLYLDESYNRPFLGGSDVQNAVKTVFTFPLVESAFKGEAAAPGQPTIPPPAAAQGWKDAEVLTEDQVLAMQTNFANAQFKDDGDWEKKVDEFRQLIKAGDDRADALEKQVDELTAQLNQKPEPAPNAKTDDEIYEAVKAGLLANGQIAVPDGAYLDQVVSAVNRFLKEQSEQK